MPKYSSQLSSSDGHFMIADDSPKIFVQDHRSAPIFLRQLPRLQKIFLPAAWLRFAKFRRLS